MAKKVKLTKGGQTVYPATVMDAVVHPDLRVDASKLIEEVNVSKIFPTGGIDGTNKYTLETAIAKIPSSLRNVGIKCSFLNEEGEPETWVHQGGTFIDVANWMQGSDAGGNMILEWNTDAATTRLQIENSARKAGMIISYYNPSTGWINEQYSSNNVEDDSWSKDANWDRILTENYFNEILTASKTNNALINAQTGEEISNNAWLYFTANVSGFEMLTCTVGFSNNETLNVGLAFYDKDGAFISGYYKLEERGYENVNLEIPSNAVTAKWSWLTESSGAPIIYDGEYTASNGDITIKSSQVRVLDGTLQDFTDKIAGKYLTGKKQIADKIDSTAVKGTDGSKIYNSSWWSYSAEVIGRSKIACTVGYSASGVGIAFFDKDGEFISGYSGLKDNAYSDVVLDVPNNAVTVMWSWSTYQDAENNGEYEVGEFVPIVNAKAISYNEETQDDFNRKVDDFIDSSKQIRQQGNAGITASSLISAQTGEEISNNAWLYFTANVSGFEMLTCTVGFSNNETLNVGLAFYDKDGAFISGYYKLEERGYENVNLEIPSNAVTAKWSWLTESSGAPIIYDGEYTLVREKTIADETGIVNHNTPNLLDSTKLEKTFNDGTNIFTPPNEGYEMSNPIFCQAGDWITRTGTATGMVVVTDENDKNGERLFSSDGSTLPNTFQIPADMTWVKYIRMAVNTEAAQSGSVVICKGKYAFTGEDKGDFLTIPKLRVEKSNLSNDILYVKNEDGSKYFQVYVDSDGNVKAREVNPDVIPDNELPENWMQIQLSGDFHGYFDRFTIMNTDFLIDLSASGPVRIKQIDPPLGNMYSNFEHFYVGSEERFVVDTLQEVVPGGKGITIFDGKFNVLDTNINGGDIHDFVFINDSHIIILTNYSTNVNVPGGNNSNIDGISAIEMVKTNGIWKGVGTFNSVDYPQLCTDAFGDLSSGAITNHQNTVGLDYDGNLILNMRNWESWIKIRRVDNGDGTYTLGSKTHNYNEAVIGRVGGRHNSGYLDSKRVLNKDFSFTNIPASLTEVSDDDWEEWQWFHCHDVKYWGMKNIDGNNYPTYTLFDNNMWTAVVGNTQYNATNKHNNSSINPNGAGNTYIASKSDNTYDKYTCSRVVQISIDWDNHVIKDYRVYIIPKLYSSEQCGATMYDEGIISISYSYHGLFGLWDFTTDKTKVEGRIYIGAKQLFLAQYNNYNYCYRANTYKKN